MIFFERYGSKNEEWFHIFKNNPDEIIFELGLYNERFVKTFNNAYRYEVLVSNNEIAFNVLKQIGIETSWTNVANRLGGELSFDINTALLKPQGYTVTGLGQKWTDDAFEIWNDKITSVKTEWTTNPNYPGGESLGYKEFYNVYYETGDKIQAAKSTSFYETMSKKGFSNIEDVYEKQNSVIVILTKTN